MSPDGHWVAFNSDESGQQEVYIQDFPAAAKRVKVGGGVSPQWSHDGKELYYLVNSRPEAPQPFAQRVTVMAATIEPSPEMHAGTPHMLFQGPFTQNGHNYAVTADGKGFIFIRDGQPPQQGGELRVIVNWGQELKR
jgi:serine/threonine-protein kinase